VSSWLSSVGLSLSSSRPLLTARPVCPLRRDARAPRPHGRPETLGRADAPGRPRPRRPRWLRTMVGSSPSGRSRTAIRPPRGHPDGVALASALSALLFRTKALRARYGLDRQAGTSTRQPENPVVASTPRALHSCFRSSTGCASRRGTRASRRDASACPRRARGGCADRPSPRRLVSSPSTEALKTGAVITSRPCLRRSSFFRRPAASGPAPRRFRPRALLRHDDGADPALDHRADRLLHRDFPVDADGGFEALFRRSDIAHLGFQYPASRRDPP